MENLQILVDIFEEVASAFSQEVSLKKSEVMFVNPKALVGVASQEVSFLEKDLTSGSEVIITANGKELLKKVAFTYLGAPEDEEASMNVVVEKVELSAKRAFNRRSAALFHNCDLSRMSRLRYYTVYVLSVLTYACETWWSLSAGSAA